MMWSAVCSGSPHSHGALSTRPHFFVGALYRPTPVRSLVRVAQCFRLRSSPLTPSPGSDTWRCTRWVRMLPTPCVKRFERSNGLDTALYKTYFFYSVSTLPQAVIVSTDRSSGMTLIVAVWMDGTRFHWQI